MILYGISTKAFTFKDSSTGEIWELDEAVWVGSPGKVYRQVIIPVIRKSNFDPTRWGVKASRAGKPKIVSDHDPTEGAIIKIIPARSFGRVKGDVLVSRRTAENVVVLAHGVSGRESTGEKWHEYLLEARREVVLYISYTAPPDELLVYDGKEMEVRTESVLQSYDLSEFIPLRDRQVPHWSNENDE